MAKEITMKEVFERVIVLETKLDQMESENVSARGYFRRMVVVLIIINIAGIVLDYFI